MTHGEAVAALEEAELDRHPDRRRKAPAGDGGRSEADLAEWQRMVQLLATTDCLDNIDADAVVQEELAADRRREAAKQAQHDAQAT
ncbi:hypothetical protein ACH4U6_16300 [Streptomyces netropsis]|uniref:hypothetical protein n=1 Tax=Streptomyces netropsis TaxID=55404 RepID=UPI00378B41BF